MKIKTLDKVLLMDKKNRTNKELLAKGLKRLGLCLLLMFLGPTLFHITLSNSDKPLYIPLFILSVITCIAAVIMLYVSLKTILDSMFKQN